MDIRLKNSQLLKPVLIFCIYLIGLSSIAFTDVVKHSEYLDGNCYFRSSFFKSELAEYSRKLEAFHTAYADYPGKANTSEVPAEEVITKKREYDAEIVQLEDVVRNGYSYNINEAERTGDKELLQKLIKERDNRISEIRKALSRSFDEVKSEIINKRELDYSSLNKSIESREDIRYYIKNDKGIFTNLMYPTNIESNVKEALYSIRLPLETNTDNRLEDINRFYRETGSTGYLIIPKSGKNGNIYAAYQHYMSIRDGLIAEIVVFIISIALAASILAYIRKKKEMEFEFIEKIVELYGRFPLDLRIAVFAAAGVIVLVWGLSFSFFSSPFGLNHVLFLTFTAFYLGYLLTGMVWTFNLKKSKVNLRSQWEGCLLFKFTCLLKDGLTYKGILIRIALILLITISYGGFLGFAIPENLRSSADVFIPVVLSTVAFILVIPVYILTKLRLFNKILKGTEEIASGNFGNSIESSGKGSLSKLACNINNMKEGFRKSLDIQVKSERLKSELITNVSHDLKTPLTSIINYVDLLKGENLTKEEAQHYVTVLDQKAQRMKTLIEDLFEVSKLSSGAVELNPERLDVAALLYQALAEFEEKIKDSSLTFKINAEKQKVYASLDGRKTWRVFENLISNILKYSQPNTRVYIDLEEQQDRMVLTMKNISAYELEFDTGEIFERFKRGDRSRNTEGSGLGLAIAKSIVELHGGKLRIETDGDLFKAVIEYKKLIS